ncbi:hypothetical protein ASZ90_017200 [hydrocarbon metagenome]|uniref:Uncharacterized protein n=1 Tax=hydrocarbon metagenome TaxID=938273 RepID=A0A0W8E9Y5_9ZZZZ
MDRMDELKMEIDEVKGFLIKTRKDVQLAQYAVDQQANFLKKKINELDLLKDLFMNMVEEREQLSPGSMTEEDHELLR